MEDDGIPPEVFMTHGVWFLVPAAVGRNNGDIALGLAVLDDTTLLSFTTLDRANRVADRMSRQYQAAFVSYSPTRVVHLGMILDVQSQLGRTHVSFNPVRNIIHRIPISSILEALKRFVAGPDGYAVRGSRP